MRIGGRSQPSEWDEDESSRDAPYTAMLRFIDDGIAYHKLGLKPPYTYIVSQYFRREKWLIRPPAWINRTSFG